MKQSDPSRFYSMRATLARIFLATSLSLTFACGGMGRGGRESGSEKITRPQILAGSYATAYDAVQALRPNWLRLHNVESDRVAVQIAVFYDGAKYGGVTALNNIRAATLNSIERIDPATATLRWGNGYSEGVLYVTSLTR